MASTPTCTARKPPATPDPAPRIRDLAPPAAGTPRGSAPRTAPTHTATSTGILYSGPAVAGGTADGGAQRGRSQALGRDAADASQPPPPRHGSGTCQPPERPVVHLHRRARPHPPAREAPSAIGPVVPQPHPPRQPPQLRGVRTQPDRWLLRRRLLNRVPHPRHLRSIT